MVSVPHETADHIAQATRSIFAKYSSWRCTLMRVNIRATVNSKYLPWWTNVRGQRRGRWMHSRQALASTSRRKDVMPGSAAEGQGVRD